MAGIGAEWEIRGDVEMRKQLEALPKKLSDKLAGAMNAVMGEELDEMKNRTPVLSGRLQGSGRIVPAVVSPQAITVGVRFGEGIPPYAVAQHEKLQYQHDEGQARFVTSVLDESGKFIVSRITRKVFPGT